MPKGARQKAIAEQRRILDNAGYVTWNTFMTRQKLYALLCIACNRINPEDPRRAFNVMEKALGRACDLDQPKGEI